MLLLLFIPIALGWVLARHYLRLKEWPELLSITLSLAVVFTLVGVNFFYRMVSLSDAVTFTLLVEAALAGNLWFWRDKGCPPRVSLPKLSHWALILLSAVVVLYANAQQIANPDDDYWIHAPLQGLMRHGNFPPTNPFFSDIPMNGHYGRNLSIVTFSYLSGTDVFMSQHLLTSALHAVTFWLFYSAFFCSSKNRTSALLGTIFVFFGINAGGRGGLIDTMQNNNVFVHLYLGLLLYLTVLIWKERSVSATLLGGLTLGSYAIVYETHFGLVFLTILGVTPILWARRAIDKKQALSALAVLVLSLPLAFTQGGPLTDLLDRKLAGREHTQAEELSKGMQNQAQVVKVTFPKEQLFQILLETGEYQRTSNIYRLDTPLKVLFEPSTDRGYAYIWSWDVLKIHFLALYLVPFSAWVLVRRNSPAGLFMGAFGTIAYLVPALVHFGPIYESEYYRWEFAASLGFAGALGLALGAFLEKSPARPFLLSGTKLVMKPGSGRYLLVGAITLLNSWACLHLVTSRFQASLGSDLTRWLIFPSTQKWLASHRVLNFDRLDYEAATYLEKLVLPGDRVLVNFAEENNFSILYESTLTGLSGARCVGHALPLEDEKIGTTPFRRSPAAQLFWEEQRLDCLSQLQVNYLYYMTEDGEDPPHIKAATLMKAFKHGSRQRFLYAVKPEELPLLYNGVDPADPNATVVRVSEMKDSLRGGEVYQIKFEAKTPPNTPYRGTVQLSTVRLSDGLVSSASENLRLNLDATSDGEGTLNFTLPFVAPHDEGTYTLQAIYHPAPETKPLNFEVQTFRSSFKEFLEEVKVVDFAVQSDTVKTDGPWPARTLLHTRAQLEVPGELPHPRDVLGCWAFYSEERKEFDLLPAINLKKFALSTVVNDLPLVTPKKPGTYRLALYVSAGQGHLARFPTRTVVIE